MPVIRATAGGIFSSLESAMRCARVCVTVVRDRAHAISRRCPRGAAAVAWQSMISTSSCESGSTVRSQSIFAFCSPMCDHVDVTGTRRNEMGPTATILHADLDAFYASVEQLLDPRLRGKPIAVGGGVVLAASYEARAFGVRSGMPGRHARQLCPNLLFVGGHFDQYQRLGDAAISVLSHFTPSIERISIDEAFAEIGRASVGKKGRTRRAHDHET